MAEGPGAAPAFDDPHLAAPVEAETRRIRSLRGVWRWLLIGAAAFTTPAVAQQTTTVAQAIAGTRLDVSATGEATRVPDVAIISAGVVTRSPTATAAIEQAMVSANHLSFETHAIEPQQSCSEQTRDGALVKPAQGLIVQQAGFSANLPTRAMQPEQVRGEFPPAP